MQARKPERGNSKIPGVKTVRIFIGSPGDVNEERDRARQVIESLRRRYAGRFRLKPILWEDLPLQADMSFQQGIDVVLSADSGIDLAIFIFWARFGSLQEGTGHRSGTEREFDLMLNARRQSGGTRPALLVYTRSDDASFAERLRGRSSAERQEMIAQKERVEQFIAERFQDTATGRNVRAFHAFDRPAIFSQRLRAHLTELLDELAGGGLTEAVWDIESQGPPFLGLAAFQPQHAPIFFGREDEIVEVRQALRQQACDGAAFVLIAGASGSGKSSLARAGVLPAIMENELDDQVHAWRSLLCTPGELGADPIAGFAKRLAEALPELGTDSATVAGLSAGLRRDPADTFQLTIAPALNRAGEKAGGPVRLIVLVDQLEELLSAPALTEADRHAFAAVLEALAGSGRAWVLATMRADFFAACQAVEPLRRLRAGRGQCDLFPPSPGALRRLIEEPARLAGLTFEKRDGTSLADAILADATGHRELLPLLEHLLADLFAHRTTQGGLTFARYAEVGGVTGALARHADETFQGLDAEARGALGSVLKALVTVAGDDEKSFVRQHPARTSLDAAAARRLVDAFIEARLFTTERASDERGTITLAHEALLRVWPPAQAWVEANADFLRVRARIESRRKQGGLLLEGDPLLDAVRPHLASDPEGFTDGQRRYLEECLAHRETTRRRRERLRRQVTTGLAILLALAVLGALWALRGEAKARAATAEAHRQAALARAGQQEAEREKAQALALVRFMDVQVGEAFTDVPMQLRERIGNRLDAFYRGQGEPTNFEDRQRRMSHHLRKAMVHLTAVRGYEQGNVDPESKASRMREERAFAIAELKEALRYGDLLAAEAPDHRGVTRDRILTHYHLANIFTQLQDAAAAGQHLLAARGLLEAVVMSSPIPLTQEVDWMGLPNLDAAMGDWAANGGDKSAAQVL
jgi:hypothetical protein